MVPKTVLKIARHASQAEAVDAHVIRKVALIVLTSPLWAPFILIGVGVLLALLLSMVLLVAMAFLGGIYLAWWLPEHWVPQIGEWVYLGPALFLGASIWTMISVTLLLGKHVESKGTKFQVGGMRNSTDS